MVEIRLCDTDRIRVASGKNFIDIHGSDYSEALTIDLYQSLQYVELRKRNDEIRMFVFKDTSRIKDFDFGWYNNAKIIFSTNRQSQTNETKHRQYIKKRA